MIDIIEYKGKEYPKFQASGNAARFIIPFAQEVCKGRGLDIGCGKLEWKLPGALGIDPILDSNYSATKLSIDQYDYIFSSHCLEHLDNWVPTLDYWYGRIREGGVLFLYLPAYEQEYWRPWNNQKHKSIFTPEIMYDYFIQKGFKNVFVSGVDLNSSFAIMGGEINVFILVFDSQLYCWCHHVL